jgi:hypothetical protein
MNLVRLRKIVSRDGLVVFAKPYVWIGEIHRESCLIFVHGRAQQKRALAFDPQLVMREVAGIVGPSTVAGTVPMSPELSSTANVSPCLSVRSGRSVSDVSDSMSYSDQTLE